MSSAAPLLGTDYKTAIKGEYIVIFKCEVSDRDGELHNNNYVVVSHVVVTKH